MWSIIVDKLLWSVLVVLISSGISYCISKSMLRRNLRSSLYADELKEIKDFLKLSLLNLERREPLWMELTQIGYRELDEVRSKIKNLTLNDAGLKELLAEYLKTVEAYNTKYFDYNRSHYAHGIYDESKINIEERDRLLSKHKEMLRTLSQSIYVRIEKLIT